MNCLQPSNQPEQPSFYDCKVLDGAVIVHCLPTAGVRTFNNYAEEVLVPYLRMQLRSCTRLGVVWDTYLPESLKDCTRAKRGKGLRRKVFGPAKLMDFLYDTKNKEELFAFWTTKNSESIFLTENIVCMLHLEYLYCT